MVIVELISSVAGLLCLITFVKRLHDLGISAKIYFSILIVLLILFLSLVSPLANDDISTASLVIEIVFGIIMILFFLISFIYISCVKGKNYPNQYGDPIK